MIILFKKVHGKTSNSIFTFAVLIEFEQAIPCAKIQLPQAVSCEWTLHLQRNPVRFWVGRNLCLCQAVYVIQAEILAAHRAAFTK